jgi:hypothetical protein|tara:strand:- start:552 stop:737 length:186 start_codon:yes stop_codon:yes gene_type:complete
MTLQDEANIAGAVATASTKAAMRAVLIGVIPIIEFGLIIALTMIVVAAPVKLVQRSIRRDA